MNQDLLETQWPQVKVYIREKWNKLTDDDIRLINGQYDQLISKIQQRYGISRDQAVSEVSSLNLDKYVKPYTTSYRDESISRDGRDARDARDIRDVRDDSGSLFKWLALAGIPLLLFAWFLGTREVAPTTTDTRTTEMTAPATNSSGNLSNLNTANTSNLNIPDNVVTDNIRRAFSLNDNLSNILNNLNIQSSDGIVTVSGTVPNQQAHDLITRVGERVVGVKQFVNKTEVK